MQEAEALRQKSVKSNRSSFTAPSRRLKGILANDDYTVDDDDDSETPIADLFPYCTVMFADIAGK